VRRFHTYKNVTGQVLGLLFSGGSTLKIYGAQPH